MTMTVPLTLQQREEVGRLADATWHRAFAYACWLTGDYQLSQDIAQESFARLMSHADRYDLSAAGPGLVFAYVKYTARTFWAKGRRRRALSLDATAPGRDDGRLMDRQPDRTAPSPDALACRNEQWADWQARLSGLSKGQLDDLTLCVGGFPVEPPATLGPLIEAAGEPRRLYHFLHHERQLAGLTAAELDRPAEENPDPQPRTAA